MPESFGNIASRTGDWLRGRAHPSHGWGRWFESSIAHHRFRETASEWVSSFFSSCLYYELSIVKRQNGPGRSVASRAAWTSYLYLESSSFGARVLPTLVSALYYSRVGTALRCYGWGPPVTSDSFLRGHGLAAAQKGDLSGHPTASVAGRLPGSDPFGAKGHGGA